MRVEFYRHHLEEAAAEAMVEALRSVFLTQGPRVARFEKAFAEHLGVPEVVAVSSCTDALILALAAHDIGPGDEVITTPLTFVATINAILLRGATPVFAEVEPDTGNLDLEAARSAVHRLNRQRGSGTGATRAIMPVHLYGHPVDTKGFRALADEHDLVLIEDAAHCVEGQREGVGPGQLGDLACFSFYATKNLTAGEGGAITVRDPAIADRLRRLRMHGLDRAAADRYTDKAYRHWDQLEPGYKANMSDLQAALLLTQIEGIESRLARREAIAQRYEAAFRAVGLGFPIVQPGVRSARHLFTVWPPAELRDTFLSDMAEAGIGVAVNYRAVHLLQWHRDQGCARGDFPNAESIGDRTVSLPFYPGMTEAEVDRVIEVVTDWAGSALK